MESSICIGLQGAVKLWTGHLFMALCYVMLTIESVLLSFMLSFSQQRGPKHHKRCGTGKERISFSVHLNFICSVDLSPERTNVRKCGFYAPAGDPAAWENRTCHECSAEPRPGQRAPGLRKRGNRRPQSPCLGHSPMNGRNKFDRILPSEQKNTRTRSEGFPF